MWNFSSIGCLPTRRMIFSLKVSKKFFFENYSPFRPFHRRDSLKMCQFHELFFDKFFLFKPSKLTHSNTNFFNFIPFTLDSLRAGPQRSFAPCRHLQLVPRQITCRWNASLSCRLTACFGDESSRNISARSQCQRHCARRTRRPDGGWSFELQLEVSIISSKISGAEPFFDRIYCAEITLDSTHSGSVRHHSWIW